MYNVPYHERNLSEFNFLITGGAGFIGSNLVEYLLRYGAKKVRVLDNLITGSESNLSEFRNNKAFEFINGDIRNLETCKEALLDIDYVSHQAALGSVPRSIEDPITNCEINITGFLNMLCAIKDNGRIKRLIYAASSSTYGDNEDLPKLENNIGKPLSPYAVTKYVNELYAHVFSKNYGSESIGLRYFNVFGPKQSPKGAYAAVIPLFIEAVKNNIPANINGDGMQCRDFTFIENVVQANIRAFFVEDKEAVNQIYNIACGESINLNKLWEMINFIEGKDINPIYKPYRFGDIKNSLADISKAKKLLGYNPLYDLKKGLELTVSI
jgi:UDP-N-acetylglucosamine 4-epimerase